MGFAAFARPALFLKSGSGKRCVSDVQRNCGGECEPPNLVIVLNKKRKQGFSSSVKRYVTEKAAPKWFSKLNADRGLVRASSSPLLSPHFENNCQQNGVSSGNKKPAISFGAAQKLGNLHREKKAGCVQKSLSCGKASTKRTTLDSTFGIAANDSRVVTAANSEDENYSRGPADKRPEIEPSSGVGRGWKLLGGTAAVAVIVVTGGAALRDILSGSAQASCGNGDFGQSGSGSGHGGGGGGHWNGSGRGGDHGGFDARSGEGFNAGSIFNSKNQQDENPTVSINFVKKASVSAGASLASLSSAAGDFIDGEAPIGADYTSRKISKGDSYQTPEQSNPRSSYSPILDEQDRQGFVERFHYDQHEDPFLRSEAEERPSAGGPQEDMRRNEEFPPTRSSLYDDPSSGKPLPPTQTFTSHYHTYHDKYRVPSLHPASSGPTSQEFISFDTRTNLTSEPLGIEQERNEAFRSHQLHEGTDFLSWVSGLFDSVLGKRSGDQNCGAEDKLLDDEKKGLVAETAALALKLLSEKGDEFAKKFETNALRRLQRETFSDLLKVRERLDRLEHKTGLRGKTHGDSLTGARTNLRGEVSAGGAFIVTGDRECVHSRASLQHAGLKTGLDVRFTFETPMRECDTLTTQVGVGQGSGLGDGNTFGGPVSLQKINYVAQISDSLSVIVAPLGARASDMSDIVNHLQGQALTTFAGSGPALYQHCKGSAIGASLRSSSVLLSMSQFLSGWGSSTLDVTPEPLCLSTLAQFMVQPCDHLVFCLSAVNNVWPSPPSPTSSGLHWSEMGPLVLCKTVTRPTGAFILNPIRQSAVNSVSAQGNLPTESWSPADDMRNRGIAMQSVSLAGEIDLGYRVSLGGWAQVERGDWLSEFEKKEFQWNVSIAKCTGQNVNWGLSIGRRKREDWHDDGLSAVISDGPEDPSTSQMQMEAFVSTGCGKGFTLQSGIVYIVDKHSQTPAFMLRSSWNM